MPVCRGCSWSLRQTSTCAGPRTERMDASGEELRQVAATRTECRQTVKVDRFRIATILAQVKQTISKRVGCRQLAESSAKLLGSFAADYLPFGTFWRSSCKEFCRNTAGPGVSVLRQGASADREDYVVLRAQHKYPCNGGYPMITPPRARVTLDREPGDGG